MKKSLSLPTFLPMRSSFARPLGFIRVALVLVALMSLAFSQADAETHEELVLRYMVVSGYSVPADELGSIVDADLYGNLKSGEQKSPVSRNRCRQEVIDIYSTHFDDDTLRKLIAWHESPTGKKTHPKIERNRTSNEELEGFMVDFSKSPNAGQRLALVKKLDLISRLTETMSEFDHDFRMVVTNAFRGTVMGGYSEEKRTIDLADVDMNNRRSEYIEHRKKALFNTLLFMYKNLTDDELKTCIAFHETDAGRNETIAKYLTLKKVVECQRDLFRMDQGGINHIFAQRIINGTEKENGNGQKVGGSAIELSRTPAVLEELTHEVRGRMSITQTEIPKGIVRYSECDIPPSINGNLKTVYPEMARLGGLQAKVFVRVLIDEHGVPIKAEIAKRVPVDCTAFDKTALNTAMSARYVSGEKNGKKVSSWMIMPIRYTLADDPLPKRSFPLMDKGR
jgi:TonB family protein